MKREGRQHGMVRTNPILSQPFNPRPMVRQVNKIGSPPTAGMFTKVSSKPTNHSKFTGKCGRPRCNGCHIHPACKAKDKAKGTQKLRSSSDVVSNLITWRVVDTKPGFKFSSSSATDILDQLTYPYIDDDCDMYDQVDDVLDGLCDAGISSNAVEIEEVNEEIEEIYESDNDDQMSFCEVGFVWEPLDGDDSWYLVEEL
ncbi:EF-Hand 1 [Abeliophyllum distichum]|uniref:EF-Hand 1 n=1 Tax=Abeliophyllum distichum TaxID=126358 RepID=A0ABD1SHB3_9LAMI